MTTKTRRKTKAQPKVATLTKLFEAAPEVTEADEFDPIFDPIEEDLSALAKDKETIAWLAARGLPRLL